MSNPAVTLWEHRAAVARLHAAGRAQVDEEAVFRAIDEMRHVAQEAASKSRAARRANARRAHLGDSFPDSEFTALAPVR